AAERVDGEARLVQEQDLHAGIDDRGEILHAVGRRVERFVAGDGGDRVVPVGAVYDPPPAAAEGEQLDLGKADVRGRPWRGGPPAGVVLRAGRDGHGRRGVDGEAVAAEGADRVAAEDGVVEPPVGRQVEGDVVGAVAGLDAYRLDSGDRVGAR